MSGLEQMDLSILQNCIYLFVGIYLLYTYIYVFRVYNTSKITS